MEKIALKTGKAWQNIRDFVKKNPVEFWILLSILAISAFLRLYKIDQYMTFLGDEGRDVIIVRRFLTELHPPLIGPGTSIGNMYLGPLYYYMMALPLLIANFSPVGPAVQVAILGVITVFFIWFVGRTWFGKVAGLVAAGLYAISPTAIVFSRSSWNPNIMPFFALLSVYSIWRVWRRHEAGWLLILGVAFAFVLQSHYLGLLIAPTLFIFWLLTYRDLKKTSTTKMFENFKKKSLIGLGIFAILMSPLLIFDIRHGWTNTRAVAAFIVSREELGFSLATYLSKAASIVLMTTSNLISAKNVYLSVFTLASLLAILIWVIVNRKFKSSLGLVLSWLVFGIAGASLLKGSVYDHYLGFLFPAPFLLIGAVAQNIRKYKIPFLVFGVYLLFLVIINFAKSPVLSDPTFQMQRAISVAKVIQEKSNGERFNLATISDLNNRDVYQYFLIIWGAPVVDTDPSSLQFTVTDQLFVVCEFPREKCDPVHNPSAWITTFGWTKIVDEWPVWGGTLFKLGHTK